MKMPNVLHPKQFIIKGIKFKVVSYDPLTDEQAKKIALSTYRQKKWTRADQKKVVTAITLFDRDTAKQL